MDAELIPTTNSTPAASLRRKDAEELLSLWLGGKSQRTVAAYRDALATFAAHVLETGEAILDARDAIAEAARRLFSRTQGEANALVLRYRNALLAQKLSPATVNLKLAAVRSLSALARLSGLVPWKVEIPGVKSRACRDTRGPGLRAIRGMYEKAQGRKDAKGRRDAAILRLLWDLGLRRAEVCALDVADLDLTGDHATVRIMGKGRRETEALTLPDETVTALQEWLAVRGDWQGPLFVELSRGGTRRRRLSLVGLWKVIRKYGCRPHAVRHSTITAVATRDGLLAAQVFGRHANLDTTRRYVDNADDQAGRVATRQAGLL